tara:strand:+ start:535 stop:1059 length:525 start_codon:yes stop_codon:yes gene_type:complete
MQKLIFTGLTLIVAISIGCSSDNNQSNTDSSNKDSKVGSTALDLKLKGELPESLKFTSGIFVNEYMRNKEATDAKFRGKTVEITGVVSTYGTNKKNVAFVNVQGTGGQGGSPVQCIFSEPGPKDAFSGLQPGLPVSVQGIVEGYQASVKDVDGQRAMFVAIGDMITLSDCAILE